MAEFVEVVKQRNRICNTISCDECGLYSGNNISRSTSCLGFMNMYPDEAEKLIMDWAKEHPVKSNADKFGEVFGEYPSEESCPFFDHCDNNVCNTRCAFGDFWNKEYINPKGAK